MGHNDLAMVVLGVRVIFRFYLVERTHRYVRVLRHTRFCTTPTRIKNLGKVLQTKEEFIPKYSLFELNGFMQLAKARCKGRNGFRNHSCIVPEGMDLKDIVPMAQGTLHELLAELSEAETDKGQSKGGGR